jgi:hypothetical protein
MEFVMPLKYPLGSSPISETLPFAGSDTEANLNKIKKIMPPEWRWHNQKITYRFNSLGHRNNFEMKDVDVSNMTAIVGCSHIEGTGVTENFTIPYFYEQLTGEKTYNLGQGGMDNQVIFFNALWAYQQGFKKIIVSWTQPERNSMLNHLGDPEIFRGPHVNPDLYYKYFTDDYTFDNPHWHYRISLYNQILNGFGIHTFQYFFSDSEEHDRVWTDIFVNYELGNLRFSEFIKNKKAINDVFARDIILFGKDEFSAHYGPVPNKSIARDMMEYTK